MACSVNQLTPNIVLFIRRSIAINTRVDATPYLTWFVSSFIIGEVIDDNGDVRLFSHSGHVRS